MNKTAFLNKKTKGNNILSTTKKLSREDLEIVTTLENLKLQLDNLYNCINEVTDHTLIDSYIFEINSIYMRYKYYLSLCKKRNLVADGYDTKVV